MTQTHSPPYDALLIANYFIEVSGGSYSQLKLQKLIYLAHMVHLGRSGGRPLIKDSFEAWNYGPVVPSVYHALKHNGRRAISHTLPFYTTRSLTPDVISLLNEINQSLGRLPSSSLVALTHDHLGAWSKSYNNRHQIIRNEAIQEEFVARTQATVVR